MNFKCLENSVGIRNWTGDGDVFLWNDPEIETPYGCCEKNKIPMLYRGVSAYVVFNGSLYYMAEDDGRFWPLTEIYHINQLRDLKQILEELINEVKNKDNPGLYLNERSSFINLKFRNRLNVEPRDRDEKDEHAIITFPIGNITRSLHWSWVKDELWLLNKVLESYEKYCGKQN